MPVVNGPTPTPTPSPTPTPPPLTGTGGLFTRIGRLGGLLDTTNTNRGTDVPFNVGEIQAEYQTSNQSIISNLYSALAAYQSSAGSFNPSINSMANATIIQMINPVDGTVNTAIANLISQMEDAGQTVQKNTPTGDITYLPGNTGNPNVVVSLRDISGASTELCFSELITATCTNDSQFSAGLAGVEPFSVRGQNLISDTFSWLFPESSGSGVNTSVSAINSLGQSGQGGQANWTVNGSFETWSVTANMPSSWEIGTGVPGTTIFQATATGQYYDGSSAMEFAGNGSENTAVRERFSLAGSTQTIRSTLLPSVQLGVNAFLKVSAVPATGVLRIALTDGSSVINDDIGSPNQLLVDLTTIGTSWYGAGWAFRTPSVLPAAVYLELKLTTALESGKKLFIDRVALNQMGRLYPGGPFMTVFSGNIDMIKGDKFLVNISNDFGGGFVNLFNKLFGTRSSGLMLPSSNSPTISDSLIS